jgi:hypothetical protein
MVGGPSKQLGAKDDAGGEKIIIGFAAEMIPMENYFPRNCLVGEFSSLNGLR